MAVTRLRARGEYDTNDDQWKIAVVSEKRAQERWKATHAWMVGADADTIRAKEEEMRQRSQASHNARNNGPQPAAGLRDRSGSNSNSSIRSSHSRGGSARKKTATRPKSHSLSGADANAASRTSAMSSRERARRNSAHGSSGGSRPASSRPPSTAQPCWQSNPGSRTGSARTSRPTSGLRHATAATHGSPGEYHAASARHHHERPSARQGDRPRNPLESSRPHHPLQRVRGQPNQRPQPPSYFGNPRVPLRTSDTIGWAQRQQHSTLSRPRRQYPKPWLNNASLSASQQSSGVSRLPSGPAPQARRAPQMRTVSRARARGAPSTLSASSSASSTMTVGEFEEKYLKNQGSPGTFVSTPFASVGLGLSAPVGGRHLAREEEILKQRQPVRSHGTSGTGTPRHMPETEFASQSGGHSATASSATTSSRPLSAIHAIERTTNIYKRQRSGFRADMI